MSLCGSDGGYLSEGSINNLLDLLKSHFADICELIDLEPSHQGKPIRAIRLSHGSGPLRRGVLFVGGMHARELVNPDALIYFAFNLAYSYRYNTDLVLGGRLYTGLLIRVLINTMDIFILPLANPDGRAFVLAPDGDRMWRGNCAPNAGTIDCNGDGLPDSVVGVDINRNFDFLWDSGLGTSSDPCNRSQTYRGAAAFSEPESRNIRQLLDTFPQIAGMIDVHSFGEDILHPWGDDQNQSLNPTQNFQNPIFDGQRGITGDDYKEYIPAADLDWLLSAAAHMRQAIADVRGRSYEVIPTFGLLYHAYSADGIDYSYARHFVDATKRKVFAMAIETGQLVIDSDGIRDDLHSFQPPYTEASCIMEEIQSALTEFCIDVLCMGSDLLDSVLLASYAVYLPGPGKRSARPSAAGLRIVKLLQQNWEELRAICLADAGLLRRAGLELRRVLPIIQSHSRKRPRVFDPARIKKVDALLARIAERGTPKLRDTLQRIQADLPCFEGKTMIEGLKAADESEQQSQPAGS